MRRRLALVLVGAACARTLHGPPLAGEGVAVPAGCEATLEGPWVLASAPSWRYQGRDDGGTLELQLVQAGPLPDAGHRPRRFGDGGAGPPDQAVDAGAGATRVRMVLQRTGQGFVGFTTGPVYASTGAQCLASFRTEVVACGDGGMTLSSQAFVRVLENCAVAGVAGEPRVDRLTRP